MRLGKPLAATFYGGLELSAMAECELGQSGTPASDRRGQSKLWAVGNTCALHMTRHSERDYEQRSLLEAARDF